jgi:hypothetical protein
MNVFMLREIVYGETYDKTPIEYTEIWEKGEGGRNQKSTKTLGQKIRQTAL